MRYTEQPDQDVRAVPAGEVWVGIIHSPRPHVAIATRRDGDPVVVARLNARDALDMAFELARFAHTLDPPAT